MRSHGEREQAGDNGLRLALKPREHRFDLVVEAARGGHRVVVDLLSGALDPGANELVEGLVVRPEEAMARTVAEPPEVKLGDVVVVMRDVHRGIVLGLSPEQDPATGGRNHKTAPVNRRLRADPIYGKEFC